jgi:POT family proton-dependent oligopeptide transporter
VLHRAATSEGTHGEARGLLGPEERDRVIVIVVITFFVSLFWAGYEQGGGLMNLFTDRSLDRRLLGHEVPTTWFQAVNPIFIFTLGRSSPGPGRGWRRRRDLSTARKMALGMLALAVSFGLLFLAARQAEAVGRAAMLWMIGAYFFQTLGELVISPVRAVDGVTSSRPRATRRP